ncbi:hypothetical protein AOQ84DRAFT_374033 [Glonium stellatum]|uniref:Uncharacterized protein n=1 Tax=Glonium stellatum TaxID=574774 RepID=A0A8E2JVU3_9PEZI|nr:hypothetical protein AOQ84DRAFT_374033 [Glonium stellatum]
MDDIAMTINSFRNLMQYTLPLFDVTLTISDAEFTALAAAAGVSGIATVSAAVWTLCSAAGALGPVGLLGGAAVATVAFSAAAIVEGIKWGDRQKTNPSVILLTIQKSLQECARFLLGLFMAAEQSEKDDSSHLERVQAYKEHLSSILFLKPGCMKAYYKNGSLKLAKDMKDLKTGP